MSPFMRILSFVGIKGGPGKSTLASALCAEWHHQGRDVLLVDLDKVQRSSLVWADYAEDHGRAGPPVVAMGDNVRTKLAQIAKGREIVVLDTPGRIEDITVAALGLSHLALLPCGPNGIEVAGLAPTILQVREVRARKPSLDAAIVINKKQANTVVGLEAREALSAAGLPVLRTELELRIDYSEAWTAGTGPTVYRPKGVAAIEVRALAEELDIRLWPRRRQLIADKAAARRACS